MSEITEQYFSYNGEWVQVPTTSAAMAADVQSLRTEVADLKALVQRLARGGRAD